MKWYLFLVLSLALTTQASADEIIVTKEQITDSQFISVLMPCNWNKQQPISLTGVHVDGFSSFQIEQSTTLIEGNYLKIALVPEDEIDLGYIKVQFSVNPNRRCQESFGFDTLTR